MSIILSVITCSHNPRAEYLSRVLTGLKDQSLSRDQWEFILIDNSCDEPLASRIDLMWHQNARHVREDKLGLTHARLRGIHEACGEVLVFVDDDNVLDPDYLQNVVKISKEFPLIGAWSGQTRPDFETTPPEWTRPYWGNLVIRSLERDVWSNLPNLPETMPCGAGLCVRSNVAAYYVYLHASGQRKVILDRVGKSLISAGDNDLAACACDVGMGVGVFTAQKLEHLISAARLEEEYLLRLTEGIAYSGIVFRSFRAAVGPYPRWKTKIADALRMSLMDQQRRKFFQASRRGERQAYLFLSTIDNGQ